MTKPVHPTSLCAIALALLGIGLGTTTAGAQSNGATGRPVAPPQTISLPPVAQFPGLLPAKAVAAPAMQAHRMAQPAAERAAGLPPRNIAHADGTGAHIMDTPANHAKRAAVRAQMGQAGNAGIPVTYHAGGTVMQPYVEIFQIFWNPTNLQTGPSGGFKSTYGGPQTLVAAWFPTHGLFNTVTEYYQTIGGVTTYINNLGGRAGLVVDTGALPASGCSDSLVPIPTNCVTDAQLRTKISAVIAANPSWTPGPTRLYMIYLPKNLGVCFTNGGACAYTDFCAYHSYYPSGNTNVIYTVQPYGNANYCWTGAQSPNGDVEADSAATASSHEIHEAVTDPLLNAWFDANGDEGSDKCNFNFGTSTWTTPGGVPANQMYNGWYFLLQQQWSNHQSACTLHGP